MRMYSLWTGIFSLLWAGFMLEAPDPPRALPGPVLVDDFEAYESGGLPTRWKYFDENKEVVYVKPQHMRPNERFFVVKEGRNQFVRAYAKDESVRIIMPAQEGLGWDLTTHPRLQWEWRANALPAGADETRSKLNDTGGAVYVVFAMSRILGPKTIKYTYSSTVPVGTVTSYNFGRMKVIVVASGADGFGEWMTINRDVVADYQQVFGGKKPPQHPLSIMLWSDSDNTGDAAEVDFDNILVTNEQ